MKIKLTILSIGAALTLSACAETTPNINANANRAGANTNTAVVVNSNQAPITSTNTGVNTNANSANSNFNYNMSREEANRDRTGIENEARRTGGSVGTGANDTWIWLKTRSALLTTSDLRESTISVDVENGVITLRGTVENQAQIKRAADVAQGIEGKTRVVNQLKVAPNDSVLNTNSTNGNANGNGNRRP